MSNRAAARRAATGAFCLPHRGISGPATLDLSRRVSRALLHAPRVELNVDLCPALGRNDWRARFVDWQQTKGARAVHSLLASYFPQSVALQLCDLAGAAASRAADLARHTRVKLESMLGEGVKIGVVGTEGFKKAVVTSGGIALDDVSAATLESRVVKGLFFAGEVLDVDGPCGGYNLQWAFSSGYLCAQSLE